MVTADVVMARKTVVEETPAPEAVVLAGAAESRLELIGSAVLAREGIL